MEKNVGGYDRIARFVVGPVLIVLGVAALAGLYGLTTGTLGVALAALLFLVGLVLTVTAITQKCVLNSVFGVNTYGGEVGGESAGDRRERGSRPD